jgi:DNA polymerase III subunit delta'
VSMWDVPGQARATEVLRGAVGREEPGHAWAFIGPPGVGQEQAARTLAAALNCPMPSAPGEPCGLCPTCDRCARGAFAAYRELVPVGAMHRVVDVRDEWLRAAVMSPMEGTWKVLRVVDADRMNEAAANAFLKGLEEPPPRTVWILEIADPEELPDTVLSRCRSLRFAPWSFERLQDEARGRGLVGAEDVRLAARASMGSPAGLERLLDGGLDDFRAHRAWPRRLREEPQGTALVLARELDDEAKRRTAALKSAGKAEAEGLAELYGGDPPRSVVRQFEARHARREREARVVTVRSALDDLVAWYRDCLLVGAGGDPECAISSDAAAELRADAEALGAARCLRAIDLVAATRDDLVEFNLQQAVALEALFLDLAGLTLG